MPFQYLEAKKDILSGKMCIKGTRISADMVLEWLANGANPAEIINTYPGISAEAISEVLQYAAELSRNTIEIEANFQTAA